jgi:hypothetical protein
MMFVLNEISLFFHDRRIETPPTKKNITSQIEEWAQAVPPPPKKLRSSGPGSVSSRISSVVAKSTTTKSTSCAVASASTSDVFQKPVPRAKRRVEEVESKVESESDCDEYLPSTTFGGLDEDEDDMEERAAAVASPVRASAATQLNKVSVYTFTTICSYRVICRAALTFVLESHRPLEKKNQRDKATANFLWLRLSRTGGKPSSSRLIFDILAA